MLSYVTAIYQSNLCKCQLSSQLYVSCILRLHSSKCLCKANLSWINQEISWCMLYVEQGILFRSQEGSARFAKMNKSPVCTLTPPHFITQANISYSVTTVHLWLLMTMHLQSTGLVTWSSGSVQTRRQIALVPMTVFSHTRTDSVKKKKKIQTKTLPLPYWKRPWACSFSTGLKRSRQQTDQIAQNVMRSSQCSLWFLSKNLTHRWESSH